MKTSELIFFKLRNDPRLIQWGFFGITLDQFKERHLVTDIDRNCFEQYFQVKFDPKNTEYFYENARRYMQELNANKTKKIDNPRLLEYALDPLALEENLWKNYYQY